MRGGIDMCRSQHANLASLSAELRARLEVETLVRGATEARQILSRLGGALIVHLAMEDRSLYPSLLSSPDPALRDMAERFRQEMGGLRARFEELTGRWHSASAIAGDASAFASQMNAYLSALEARIWREDHELFPLAERTL